MKITSVKGTNDFLPKQAELRDNIQKVIIDTYKSFGFNRIYTPILEDIENLEKSDGGDNLNLIFKILKRGDKFTNSLQNNDFNNLADLGLRYDLTLPLSRFYNCHKANLPNPFKCIQVDQVFRAERPQKGRDREFIQCDIDILGSEKIECEIELIDVTAHALLNVGLKDFKIKINDRRILKKLLLSFGFKQEDLDSVCITFDKQDKIGINGVEAELLDKGFGKDAINNLVLFISSMPKSLNEIKDIVGDIEEINQMQEIISSVEKLAENKYGIVFDISLVRGQGYYTGAVFEIESNEFSCSVGGGGRYDNLIGKFSGTNVPAVGFSIGFERIFAILSEKENSFINNKKKIAVIYSKENFVDAMKFAKSLHGEYSTYLVENSNKFGKLLNRLAEQDFGYYVVVDENKEIKILNKF